MPANAETYCTQKCNQDPECKGYMKRMDDKLPGRFCGIATSTICTEFDNSTMTIECIEWQGGNIGELLTHSTCTSDFAGFWSGCYIRFGEWRSDI